MRRGNPVCFVWLVMAMAQCMAFSNFAADSAPVTYTRDIAPIFFKNCASCHRPVEVAPFSLLSYGETAGHAKTIARVTGNRFMPPWKAEPGAGEFRGARRLSEAELGLIQRWVDAGAPEGDPQALPPAPVFSDAWKLGEPDLVLSMPQAYSIPAEGKDIYQCFVIPLHLTEDKYIVAFEYHPGNRRVVHHAIVSQDSSGEAIKRDAEDPDIGYRTHGAGTGLKAGYKAVLGIWTPGFMPNFLPEGVGLKLEKNAVVVLQNHYHSTGKPETDLSSVGLYFAKTTPDTKAIYTTVWQNNVHIPPGDKHYQVHADQIAGGAARVLAVTPHMHLLGQELKLNAVSPDGSVKPMVWVKNWDFNWQCQYFYEKPFRVLKGTRLVMDASFDNSEENPRNPNHPPKLVNYGEQTTDEMAGVILLVAPDSPFTRPVAKIDAKALDACVGRYDLGSQKILTISNELGTLMARLDSQQKIDLFPESETEFFARLPEAELKFEKNPNGNVIGVNVTVDGKSHSGRRMAQE